MTNRDKHVPFPTEADILSFLKDATGRITKREIARAFHIRGQEKVFLKQLLRNMEDNGLIAKDNHKAIRPADSLPAVQVIEFKGIDSDGDVLVQPVNFVEGAVVPTIYLQPDPKKRGPAFGKGDQALVRLARISDTLYHAHVIKRLNTTASSVLLAVYHGNENGGRLTPVDKKDRNEYAVDAKDRNSALDGELVEASVVNKGKRIRSLGLKSARVKARIGDMAEAKSISLIAIHAHGIPVDFSKEALAEAEAATPVTLGKRTDLRDIDLVTIDPADARDHDDAIWAEADTDPANKDGWHAIVAIADVAHYVQSGKALDKDALTRGNSCYFPDRVVSMLPEVLSAGLCSLMPGEDRAAMAVHLWFDKDGNKIRHKFVRALIRSTANITYQRVQDALDGHGDPDATALLETVLTPLNGVFKAIMIAREKRQPLDLDMPERRIQLGEDGHVESIVLKERLDAHRIVEELMIAANVAAAQEIESHKLPTLYRVHDVPSMEKMEALRDFLQSLDLNLAKGQVLKPQAFNGILHKVKDGPQELLVSQVVLRSQMQALYTPENTGHFGLALQKYAHFTSPIRRYADLIVHRCLIRGLKLGSDGITDGDIEALADIGEAISATERRAMVAERDSNDRYLAAYLSDHVGDELVGRISGVNKFGLFVSLEQSGGDGLIPISSLHGDYYNHDETLHSLIGERFGYTYQLGQTVNVKLLEANKFTGGLRLELLDGPDIPEGLKKAKLKSASSSRGRGKPHRKGGSGSKKSTRKGKKPRGGFKR